MGEPASELDGVEKAQKVKKPRSEAQIASMESARLKALAGRESRRRTKVPVLPRDESVLSDGAPDTLQVMRHVHLNAAKHDRTEPQRTARKIKEKYPERFISMLGVMEKEFAATKVVVVQVEEVLKDEGLERCVLLVEKWLEENGVRSPTRSTRASRVVNR